MLKEAMKALRVTDLEYASDITRLLKAAELDLKTSGVIIDGEIDITITETEDQQTGEVTYTVTDESDIEDDAIITALITFAMARGSYAGREDREQLEKSYQAQMKKLANTTGYTNFGEEAGT